MADTRLFTELSKEEKEVLFEELKSLKLSCSPASMTVEEIEKLIASAKDAKTMATEAANVSTAGTDETSSESDRAVVEGVQTDEPEAAASSIPSVNAVSKSEEAESVQPQENKSQQKTKKKADKGAVFNGICIVCGEKVFNNECSSCGRKY